MRDHGATSTTAHTEPEPVLARTCRSPSRSRPSISVPLGRHERELVADVVGELDRLQPQLRHRGRDLEQLRPERRPQPAPLGGRLAQRRRPPPRPSTDEPGRHRHLAQRPPRPLRPREQPVEQRPEGPPQRQLVRDRLGEGEGLRQLCRRRSPTHTGCAVVPRSPPARLHARFPSGPSRSSTAPPGSDASSPSRRTPSPSSSAYRFDGSGNSESGSGSRKPCSSFPSTITACPGRATLAAARATKRRAPAPARGSQADPTEASALVERRLHSSVEPLDAVRLERDEARLDRLDCEARVLQAPQHSLPLLLDRGRVLLDQHEVRAGGERLPHAHARLHAGGLGGRRDRPDAAAPCPGSGASAAGTSASLGRERNAARSVNPGMRRQAITEP